MARTHILLGYGSAQRDALPLVLHVGRDADAALKARNKALLPGSGIAVVEHLDGPTGYRKTNINPGEPFVVVDDSAVSQADKEQLALALEESERRLKEAEDKLAAAAVAHAGLLAANEALKASDADACDRLAAVVVERNEYYARVNELEAQLTSSSTAHAELLAASEAKAADLQSRLSAQMAAKAKK